MAERNPEASANVMIESTTSVESMSTMKLSSEQPPHVLPSSTVEHEESSHEPNLDNTGSADDGSPSTGPDSALEPGTKTPTLAESALVLSGDLLEGLIIGGKPEFRESHPMSSSECQEFVRAYAAEVLAPSSQLQLWSWSAKPRQDERNQEVIYFKDDFLRSTLR